MNSETPHFVITIGRQTGSGGRIIGQELSRRLGTAYYDKEVLSQAAADTGLGPKVFHATGDQKGVLRQLIGAVRPFVGGGDFYANQLSDETIFSLQSALIRKLAAERSCVIVGRVADHILADHPRCVRLFITADDEERIRRMMDERKVSYKVATNLVAEGDEQRAGYYNFHAAGTWGSADTYDLCVNVSRQGLVPCIDWLEQYIRARLQLNEAEE